MSEIYSENGTNIFNGTIDDHKVYDVKLGSEDIKAIQRLYGPRTKRRVSAATSSPERNSILNLAVIHGRHKVVRWLVDTKNADIETSDRGNFTPLLNAAWSGDRWLVRFFLQRRCNRNVKGTQHYTQGIAPPGFMGKTAE